MNDKIPSEKVFRVLELISQRPGVSQRELAARTGFSLGLINLTLRRLIQTGHIKVSALNRRKLQYLLTKKGLFEKTNKTTQYIARTLETFSKYKRRIDGLLSELIADGYTSFALLGRGEVSSLIELFLNREGTSVRHRYVEEGDNIREEEILLDCRLRNEVGGVGVSVLERLLQVKTVPSHRILDKQGSMEVV